MKKWSEFSENFGANCLEEFSSPTFKIKGGGTVFAIGSCFARNIEDILYRDFKFPFSEYCHKVGEYSGARPRGIMNKFTPLCMLSELEWFFEIHCLNIDFEDATAVRYLYRCRDEQFVIDLGLQQYIPVSHERFWERRKDVYSIYKKLITSDCVILTLGMIEQWYYNSLVVQHSPNNRQMLEEKSMFDFGVLSFEDVEDSLKRIVRIIKAINSKPKILFTVSPVPLEKTFSNDHVYVANSKSKSTLLSAVSSVLEEGVVDYFPSYEMVSIYGSEAFEGDKRHVKNSVVEKVCEEFMNAYT